MIGSEPPPREPSFQGAEGSVLESALVRGWLRALKWSPTRWRGSPHRRRTLGLWSADHLKVWAAQAAEPAS